MRKYEKPKVTFKSLRASEAVAETCWGLTERHNKQVPRYYDVKGPGYLKFNVRGFEGSCSTPDAYSIKYYKYEGADPQDGIGYEKVLEEALKLRGGNDGEPYKNLEFDFPQKPDPKWS